MAIDRGGLKYSIEIKGNFGDQLRAFNEALVAAQASWKKFRDEVTKTSSQTAKAKNDIRRLTGETTRQSAAAKQSERANRRQAETLSAAAQVWRNYARQVQRAALAAETEALAQRRRRAALDQNLIRQRAQAAAARDVSRALETQIRTQERLAIAQELGIKLSADGTRVFDLEAEARRKVAIQAERQAVAARAAAISTQQSALRSTFGRQTELPRLPEEAQRTLDARRAAERQLSEFNRKEAIQNLINTEERFKRLRKPIADVTNAGRRLQGVFSNVAFTFRRLVGVLALFTIARRVVQGFFAMTRAAIQFNATIEQTQIGFAGLIVAAGQISDAFGNVVQGEEAFIVAQKIASQQIRRLQRDAQFTIGTFEDLAKAFTTAVAPGLQAGLSIDQIREFTVLISQAAAGLGVAQNQLAEEIRSLFQGTITPRNTRIATALGISNEDIRNAKELGILFQFLENRFEGIARAGQSLIKTFNAELTNANDAFRQLLGAASTPFFDEMKKLIVDFRESVQNILEDVVEPDPQALSAFQSLFQGLADAVEGIRNAFNALDFGSFAGVLNAVGQGIALFATALAQSFVTIVNLLGPTLNAFGQILRAINFIIDQSARWIRFLDEVTGGVAGVVAQYGLMLGILTGIGNILRLTLIKHGATLVRQLAAGVVTSAKLLFNFGLLRKGAKALAVALRLAFSPLVLTLVALVAVAKILEPEKFIQIAVSIRNFLAPVIAEVDDLFSKIFGFPTALDDSFENAAGIVGSNLSDIKTQVDAIIKDLERDIRTLQTVGTAQQITLGIDSETASALTRFLTARAELEEKILAIRNKQAEAAKRASTAETRLAASSVLFLETQNDVENSLLNVVGLSERQRELLQASLRTSKARAAEEEKLLSLFNQEAKTKEELLVREKDIQTTRQNLARIESQQARVRADLAGEQIIAQGGGLDSLAARAAVLGQDLIENQGIQLQRQRELALAAREQVGLEEELNRARERGNALTAEQLRQDFERRSFRAGREIPIDQINSAAAVAAELAGTNERLLELVELRQKASLIEIENIQSQKDRKKELMGVESSLVGLVFDRAGNEKEIKQTLELQLRLQKQNALLTAQEEARLGRIRQELERANTLASGDFAAGLAIGFQDFANTSDTFAQFGRQFAIGMTEGVTGILASGIVNDLIAQFDPNTSNFDWRGAFRALGVELATALVEQLITSGITEIIGTTGDAAGAASQAAAQKAAAEAVTTSSVALSGASKELITAATFAAEELIGAGALLANSIITAASEAAVILGAASLGTSTGGGGSGQARGGLLSAAGLGQRLASFRHERAPGFARGGSPRPYRDPRDRIPVFARVGEWMMKPEAGRFYGNRIMSMINDMQIDPALLRQIAGVEKRHVRIRKGGPGAGFAGGGQVSGGTRAPVGATQTLMVQPIQFHDEQTMDQALAAGSRSLIRFTRQNSSEMRTAIGSRGQAGP